MPFKKLCCCPHHVPSGDTAMRASKTCSLQRTWKRSIAVQESGVLLGTKTERGKFVCSAAIETLEVSFGSQA